MSKESVYYDEDNKVVVLIYGGFLTLEEFKDISLRGLQLRKSKSSNVQLAFVDDMKVLSLEIQEWIKKEWVSEAVEGGLKHIGFLVPKSAVAKMSMKSVNKEAEEESPINIQYFSNKDEIFTWVKSLG